VACHRFQFGVRKFIAASYGLLPGIIWDYAIGQSLLKLLHPLHRDSDVIRKTNFLELRHGGKLC
jgi:hypothetical protein